MRNMAFSMKTRQMRQRIATVTRRIGWNFLKAGDRVMAVEKAQGLKKGDKVVRLGELLVLGVRREKVSAVTKADVVREGFQGMSRKEFIDFYCQGHKCEPESVCTRIEFQWVDNLRVGERPIGKRENWRQVSSIEFTNATSGQAKVCNGFGELSEVAFQLARLEWLWVDDGLVPWGKARSYVNDLLNPKGLMAKEVFIRESPGCKHAPWICEVEFQRDEVWWNLSEHLANRKDLGYRGVNG